MDGAGRAKLQQGLSQEEREWAAANAEALKKNHVFLASVEKFWTLALSVRTQCCVVAVRACISACVCVAVSHGLALCTALLGQGAAADSEAKKALLGFAQYLKLHVRLTKLLSPSFSGSHDASLRELARHDWVGDLERVGNADTSTETGRMDWVTFVESLFELCDLWTVTPVSDETAPAMYAAFLDSCFERVTAPGAPSHGAHAEESADSSAGQSANNEAEPADDKTDASSESRAAAPASPSMHASAPAPVTWRDANDVVSCIGADASPLDGVVLLPPPQPTKAVRTAKLPELAPKSAVVASEPVTALAEADGRDTSSPPGAWGELEAPSPEPEAKPTPPKKRSGRRTGRILRDKQLTKEERQVIEQARMIKQQTVDVVSADGATTTFDLRRMRATKYGDLASKEAAERGEPVETQQHNIQLDSVEVPAWVTKPEVRSPRALPEPIPHSAPPLVSPGYSLSRGDRIVRLGNNRWSCAQSSLKSGRTRSRHDSSNLRTGLSTCGLGTSTSSTQTLLAAHLRSVLSIHRASAHPFDAWHAFRSAAPGYSRAQGASVDLQVDG
eukprot:COSAG02_NODE_1298_length_13386_cov_119.041921_6_plen_560_part_00